MDKAGGLVLFRATAPPTPALVVPRRTATLWTCDPGHRCSSRNGRGRRRGGWGHPLEDIIRRRLTHDCFTVHRPSRRLHVARGLCRSKLPFEAGWRSEVMRFPTPSLRGEYAELDGEVRALTRRRPVDVPHQFHARHRGGSLPFEHLGRRCRVR